MKNATRLQLRHTKRKSGFCPLFKFKVILLINNNIVFGEIQPLQIEERELVCLVHTFKSATI